MKTPMVRLYCALIVVGVAGLAQTVVPQPCLGAAPPPSCAGKYKGKTPSPGILQQHAAWVNDGGPYHLDDPKVANDQRRANLCGADLIEALL